MTEEGISTSITNSSENSAKHEQFYLYRYANRILKLILEKNPDVTVFISDRQGKVLSSTVSKRQTLEDVACIMNFTDKARFVMRKLREEDLDCVRLRTKYHEIIVTFDELLEIVTIQRDKSHM